MLEDIIYLHSYVFVTYILISDIFVPIVKDFRSSPLGICTTRHCVNNETGLKALMHLFGCPCRRM